MNEKLQAERELRARIKTRLDHGCMFTSCQEHGPADAADITLVNCIYMAEHVRHYGTAAGLTTKAQHMQKTPGHRWQKEMEAFLSGRLIEARFANSDGQFGLWGDCPSPQKDTWDNPYAEFRIKDSRPREERPFYVLAELLHTIGWRSPNDAQWSELEKHMARIREIISPVDLRQESDIYAAKEAGHIIQLREIEKLTPDVPDHRVLELAVADIKRLEAENNRLHTDHAQIMRDLKSYHEADEAEKQELGRLMKEHGAQDGEFLPGFIARKDRIIWELIQALSPFYLFASVYKDRHDILTDVLRHKHQGLCVGAFQTARETLSEVLKSCPTKQ